MHRRIVSRLWKQAKQSFQRYLAVQFSTLIVEKLVNGKDEKDFSQNLEKIKDIPLHQVTEIYSVLKLILHRMLKAREKKIKDFRLSNMSFGNNARRKQRKAHT